MASAAFKLQRDRKAAGTRLDFRTSESLVLIDENDYKADDEKRNHRCADEVVVTVEVEGGKVQSERATLISHIKRLSGKNSDEAFIPKSRQRAQCRGGLA